MEAGRCVVRMDVCNDGVAREATYWTTKGVDYLHRLMDISENQPKKNKKAK